jgi:hypothetical protein
MKTIQIVLAATATAGTVAIGGGAFAMAGGFQEPTPPSAPVGLPASAPTASTPALPVDPPNCVPVSSIDFSSLPPELQSKLDVKKLKAQLQAERLKAKQLKSKLPANAPTVPANAPTVPANAPTTLPSEAANAGKSLPQPTSPQDVKAAAADAVKRLSAGVPVCPPQTPVQGAPSTVPTPSVPAQAPTLPTAPKLSCDSVTPVVQRGSSVENSITTLGGLKFASTKVRTITVKGQQVCVKAQQWNGTGGAWLNVERLKSQGSLEQVRQGLGLAQGQAITMGRDIYWRSPLPGGQGTGIMWSSAPGVVELVSASPELQGQLQTLAMQLHQVK